MMSGTYGRRFIGLQASNALSLYLANSLQAKMQKSGSTLYKLTWKVWAMPSGRRRFRLRAWCAAHIRAYYWLAELNREQYEERLSGCREGRQEAGWSAVELTGLCLSCGLAHPAAGMERAGIRGEGSAREAVNGYAGCDSADSRPGPVNGFWGSADWLFCRDGKWRPVKPGLKPLVDGVPSRVGKLRASGNAVNIYAAATFLKAYMEIARPRQPVAVAPLLHLHRIRVALIMLSLTLMEQTIPADWR
jgi:hypothetical protein